MPTPSSIRRVLLAPILVLALAASACTAGGDDGLTGSTTTSTVPSTETTTSTTSPPVDDLDPGVAEDLRRQIAELVVATEDIRGLPFLRQPEVAVLSPADFADRVRALVEDEIDPVEIDVEGRLFKLFGQLAAEADLGELLLDLLAEQVAGFYDGGTQELVVAGDEADISAYQKSVIVHELIHALTDQHFGFDAILERLVEEQRYDEASALQALVEGDATYFQFVYIETLPPGEQIGLLAEALSADLSVLESVPGFLRADLEFPYDQGLRFVQRLVAGGGIAAVDRAYTALPTSTEQIIHPQKYEGREAPHTVAPVALTIDGYDQLEVSTFGEWGLRLLLLETLSPALLTQTADGWGGDSYGVFYDEDDVAFALVYAGDSEGDAIELAEGLLELARESLALGDGVDEAGGKLFATDDRYLFIDRRGDDLVFIATTDPAAGASIRAQLEDV